MLLSTRASVLNRLEAHVAIVCSVEDTLWHLAQENYDLLFLCHTVHQDSACDLLNHVNYLYPSLKVARLGGSRRLRTPAKRTSGYALLSLWLLFRWSGLLESGKLLLGLLQESGVGVGVSPEGKEVLVGIHSRGAIAFSGKSLAKAEPGERIVN